MRIEDLSGKPSCLLAYLLWPLAVFACCCNGGETTSIREETKILTPAAQEPNRLQDAVSITFRSNRLGHFTGTVMINNVPMPFMIDTGATMTVIPKDMAASAKLPVGRSVVSFTAGGRARVAETKITSLKIGNMEINNLDGRISEYLNFVLIGMNTLKHFRMMQSGDTLTLAIGNSAVVRNSKPDTGGESAAFVAEPLVKKSIALKKSVVCDANQVCKTTYSDH